MTPSARLSGAIEVLTDIAERRRPAADALKDWGLSHRFAGSGDRAALATLVYDTLRRRASAAFLIGADTPRAALMGTLRLAHGLPPDEIARLFSGERFAPAPLTEAESERLATGSLDGAPIDVAADVPAWIVPSLERTFGADLVAEGEALAARAPLDLRVNLLKADRASALADLAYLSPMPTPLSPWGLRIPLGANGRAPAIAVEPAFLAGTVEVQDEGSQLAALLTAVRPGEQVIDLCAGGGGKTLALAAMTDNQGQVFATDADLRRLAPIHERLRRAGTRNVEVRTQRGRVDPVEDLAGTMDCVMVDAPCTGSGTWRRNPDAKWRLRPGTLSGRIKDQETVLDRATRLVKPGGRIVYVTCSVLPEENDEAVSRLLATGRFRALDRASMFTAAGFADPGDAIRTTSHGIQMSPRLTGTDGFYVSVLQARA